MDILPLPISRTKTKSNLSMYQSINNLTESVCDALESNNILFSPILIAYLVALLQISSTNVVQNQLVKFTKYNFGMDDIVELRDVLSTNKYNISVEKSNSNTKYDRILKMFVSTYSTGPNFNLSSYIKFTPKLVHGFNRRFTTTQPFNNNPDTVVYLMNNCHHYNYYENTEIQLVELPIVSEINDYVFGACKQHSMSVRYANLTYTINNRLELTHGQVAEYINNAERNLVDLYIPRITRNKNTDLRVIFGKLGIDRIFMTDTDTTMGQALDKLVHKIEFELVESADDNRVNCKKADTKLVFDHDFYYYIRDVNSNCFLSWGYFTM